jgi:hypothetical protein
MISEEGGLIYKEDRPESQGRNQSNKFGPAEFVEKYLGKGTFFSLTRYA